MILYAIFSPNFGPRFWDAKSREERQKRVGKKGKRVGKKGKKGSGRKAKKGREERQIRVGKEESI